MRRAVCVIGVVLALAGVSSAFAQPPAAAPAVADNAAVLRRVADEKARLATAIRQATIKLRVDEANKVDEKTLAADRTAQSQLIDQYRQTVGAEVVARAAAAPPGGQGQAVADVRTAADAQTVRTGAQVSTNLPPLVESATVAEKARLFANEEASLITARVEQEIAGEAARRAQPIVENLPGFTNGGWRVANATQLRMKELLDRITSVNVEEPRLPSWTLPGGGRASAVEREVEEWKRRQQRDADIQEYMRLAEGGLFKDPTTGETVTGELRDRVAKNAKLELAELLRRKGIEPSAIRTLFGWTDSRTDLALQIEQEVKANNWYQALDYLNPSMTGAPMGQVFHAMAGVLRKSATEVHDWRAGVVPEGGNGGVTGWLYENFVAKQQVGLRTAVRVGSSELSDIDKRIDDFERQLQAVVDVFNAAADTSDPTALDPATHQLLEQSGYIGKTPSGTEYYRVPTQADLTGALQKNLNLPGASMLDMISAASIMKIVLLTAAPEMAAARVGLLLEGLEVGGVAIKVAQTATQLVVNAGATAVEQRIKVGTVEWDRIVLDTVVMGVAMPVVGTATGAFAEKTAQLFKDPVRRQLAEAAVREALGLTSDAALQTYWSARVQGTGLSYEELLANAFNSLVGRAAPAVGRAASGGLTALVRRLAPRSRPEWFERLVTGDAELARLDQQRREELATNVEEAAQRVANVVGENVSSPQELATPENVQRITQALETGQVRFTDLKMLYQDMPWLFEPMMREVVAYRQRIAEGILGLARRAAVKEINAIADQMRADAERMSVGPERDAAVKAAEDFRTRETGLAEAEVKTPGSGNVTSDIDRSSQSAYLRNQIKKMADAAFSRHGLDVATTALAYDLNEYINVFDIINRQNSGASPRGVTVTTAAGPMSHADAVEAASMAAAMQHMTPAERTRYADNKLKAAKNDPAMARKLRYATDSLARGENELNVELARLARDEKVDISNPDAVTKARDNLYGRRTKTLNELEAQLESMDPNSAAAKELASRIQLEWAFALREGIEAYSDFAGLDMIVQKAQMAKKKVRELINDATVTGQAMGMTTQEALGMLNDQITMIVEHVNAFNEGIENATQTGSALSKYGERAVLAKKLAGENITTGANRELSTITERLAAVRDKPAELQKVLAQYGGGSAVLGVKKLVDLIARTVPGLDGVFDPRLLHDPVAGTETGGGARPATAGATAGPRGLLSGLRALQRERDEERRALQLAGGSRAVADALTVDVAQLEAELAALKAEDARVARMATEFRAQDFEQVRAVQSAIAAIDLQIGALPAMGYASGVRSALAGQRKTFETSLANYRRFRTNTGNTPPGASEDDLWRQRRIKELERQIPALKADQTRYADQARAEQARAASGLPTSWSPLLLPDASSGLFAGGSGIGSFTIGPNGFVTYVPPGMGFAYPGAFSSDGQVLLFPSGAALVRSGGPVTCDPSPQSDLGVTCTGLTPGVPPLFTVPGPLVLPGANVTTRPDGSTTFGGLTTPFIVTPFPAPGPGGATTPGATGGGSPGGIGPATGGALIGGGFRPSGIPNGPLFGWGESERFFGNPEGGRVTDGPTGAPSTTTPAGPAVAEVLLEELGRVDVRLDEFCCDEGVQPLVLHVTAVITAQAVSHPPSLALAARTVKDFVTRLLAPRGLPTATSAVVAGGRPGVVPTAVMAQRPDQGGGSAAARPVAVLTSLGTSQGEAFSLQVVNDTGRPLRLSGDGVVVEPLKRQSQQNAQRELQRALGDRLKRAVTAKVEGYCLSYALAPPSAGTLFRIAPPAVQEKFRSIRHVLAAADRLAATGALHPDTDPKSYAESIKQYATWTSVEQWDFARFSAAWLDRTKKTALALKRNWTNVMQQAIINAAPGRWRDIQAILAEGDALVRGPR